MLIRDHQFFLMGHECYSLIWFYNKMKFYDNSLAEFQVNFRQTETKANLIQETKTNTPQKPAAGPSNQTTNSLIFHHMTTIYGMRVTALAFLPLKNSISHLKLLRG